MKKTDLEKLKGVKLTTARANTPAPGRFGAAVAVTLDRREQRKQDKAQGLVPFAVKLDGELIKRVRAGAEQQEQELNQWVAQLLEQGLSAQTL